MDAEMVEIMSVAAYQRANRARKGAPTWPETTEIWKEMGREEMRAALEALRINGYTISKA